MGKPNGSNDVTEGIPSLDYALHFPIVVVVAIVAVVVAVVVAVAFAPRLSPPLCLLLTPYSLSPFSYHHRILSRVTVYLTSKGSYMVTLVYI